MTKYQKRRASAASLNADRAEKFCARAIKYADAGDPVWAWRAAADTMRAASAALQYLLRSIGN